MKKNNKGFSLVELIVVILIMAILGVALTPQVMKWVENSRIASDVETRNDLEKLCQLALTKEELFAKVKDGGYTITITKNSAGTTVVCDSNGTSDPLFWDTFFELGGFANLQDFKDNVVINSTPTTVSAISNTKINKNSSPPHRTANEQLSASTAQMIAF